MISYNSSEMVGNLYRIRERSGWAAPDALILVLARAQTHHLRWQVLIRNPNGTLRRDDVFKFPSSDLYQRIA